MHSYGLQVEGPRLVQDTEALISLKLQLGLVNPQVSSLLFTWGQTPTDSCTWKGVQCTVTSGVTRVTNLNLSNSKLRGGIPAQISNLTALVSVSLNLNQFNGTIPSEIGNISSLTYLDLSSNGLTGGIPETFLDLINLQYLNMAGNQLTGGIPDALPKMCGNLESLNISNNPDLGGQLPLGINACKYLTVLDLEFTKLQGSIPMELGQIPGLRSLNLGSNSLTGSIPDGLFASCEALSYLDLSGNQLIGNIPPAIGNCSALKVVMLSQNNLTSIQAELGLLTNLTWLFLGQNQFGGEVPQQITSLISLQMLDLRANNFRGRIPQGLGQLKFLKYLMLQSNNLTGSLPAEITTLPNLIYLDVSDNPLGSTIPDYLGNLTNIQFLFLVNNSYSGYIPNELGFLTNLQVLDLGDNMLTGSIPKSIGNLHKLLYLRLANNRLTGVIPDEIGNCQSLIWLNLFKNLLSGAIPESIGSIGNMSGLTLASNSRNLIQLPPQLGECNIILRFLPKTEGPFTQIPTVLNTARCSIGWNSLILGDNVFSYCKNATSVAANGYLQLSMNNLSGSLPMSFSNIDHFNGIFIEDNHLSGNIPAVFNTPRMTFLSLHNNFLSGPLPSDFSNMKCIELMDFSFNYLSGSIPTSLEQCTTLTAFNVSYNPLLSGPIPVGGQFLTFPGSSYLGDDLLCYSNINNSIDNKIPRCHSTAQPNGPGPPYSPTPSAAKLATSTIVGIILVCILGLLILTLGGFYFLKKTAVNPASDLITDDKESVFFGETSVHVSVFSTDLPKELKYTDLMLASNNFDETNIISSQGFGVIYKAQLMDGSLVAIKKLLQQGSPELDQIFLGEIETIGHTHQQNLLPLLGCAVIGSEKLLVYKYMVNGSLDDWLHEQPRGKQTLHWQVRLKIAVGMARGLKFLHHNCSIPIIHGDMKSSNVLLEENFEPRLTDFGLAGVLNASESQYASSILVANVGYIPPEYIQTWRATIKGDVYSFGVVLLELITGRRPVEVAYNDKHCRNIVEWVKALSKERKERDAYDPVVTLSGAPEELQKFLQLATWCTEQVSVKRPTMRDVVAALEEIKNGNLQLQDSVKNFG
ncbi:hypothetical protein O6H91_17G048200 [Diphasiastrum complanatum]|uniref:Uncharacterized protein n=1 Tax=Diphasiastrum complanatum TaxID=34168 RepID=A0ACC2B7H6_DIPCM|nr:hypothetical protein O6H91_17G048200 [Diphasiastrum complanatum]